ncbi:hypothetical protein A3A84_00570 [Candidatus Collierbacteria bacterium RIFCSPLOWO2_01_FULL_50_23]|uniref:Uncharacterized protein n=2 Tax=Candidatus Collieribacteriota TaxID=1752725 RepID=A0A1F5EVK8_9BACT|nr:MAG: hypothetical protein A2703_00645 [Candidatus Collierbacteria bacterium RIFCSPHIGHO2_01_FULL_50_25]OGD71428.1 MAG: hypothetical protein A3D09_00230 [Candidatus Collierbacteria bacterium RIFCSPHIGHO2_02_FULL_49_10]OGD73891.1 MAG: hypothetical protein A3A84_00570 [Candidatus Collierbacteria bacterium RIFCSPLOWO2_01_FULL_50_23]
MDKDEPKQLKLTNRSGGESQKEKKEKKEKDSKGNRWVIVLLLLATIIASLIFSIGGPARQKSAEENREGNQENPLGAPRVYQF